MKGEGAERLGWLRRRNLSEHEFMMICEKVVETDFAVDRGPDHGPPVGSLEVSLHDLVEFAVTEHHGLQTETFCPQQTVSSFRSEVRSSWCLSGVIYQFVGNLFV